MSDQDNVYKQLEAGEVVMSTEGGDVVSVENEGLRLAVRRESGEYQVLHKPTGRVWSGPAGRLCSMTILQNDGREASGYDMDRWVAAVDLMESVDVDGDAVRLTCVMGGRDAGARTSLTVEFTLALLSSDDVKLSYRVLRQDPRFTVHSVAIVDDALPIADEGDHAILPAYQGEVVPVGARFSYLPEDRRISIRTSDVVGTYTGVGTWNMAMFALVKGASTAVISWDDPSVESGAVGEESLEEGWEIRSTVVLAREARSVRLHFMHEAGYVQVAGYWREIAKQRGFFHTFQEKIDRAPDVEKNVGALRFTVCGKWGRSETAGWARFVAPGESRIDYTFEEVADVNEHLVNDLGIEKGLTNVKAWSRRGYDMDYPDVLPAAEECGGNEGLARASDRVRALGWQFGVHDNCLILFREAPSSDAGDALVRRDGTVVHGGIGIDSLGWQTYACCPARMSASAHRNYPQFRDVLHLNFVYSDQIAAMPVLECFSPDHPLTHQQTIETYGELIDYKRSHVPSICSEIADEWAVPMFDTMGLAFVISHPFAYPIPLFELVYHECVNLEPWPWGMLTESIILNCISRGRMPYLPFPNRDYLTNGFDHEQASNAYESWWMRGYEPDHIFLRGDGGWGEELNEYDRLVKNVYEVTSPLNELTVHQQMTEHEYLTADREVDRVAFADGTTIVVNRTEGDYEHQGTLLPSRGFLASGPSFVAFYAKRHDGVEYPEGAMFAVRSQDGKPISESREVRVYHGFGDANVKVGGRVFTVAREEEVDPQE